MKKVWFGIQDKDALPYLEQKLREFGYEFFWNWVDRDNWAHAWVETVPEDIILDFLQSVDPKYYCRITGHLEGGNSRCYHAYTYDHDKRIFHHESWWENQKMPS